MTKGWCPVHDRVFESADGSCPECGTTLVEVEPHRPADEGMVVVPESEDAHEITVRGSEPDTPAGGSMPIGPATLATVVTAVVVVAFLAGLAFPRGRGAPPAAGRTPQALADIQVGTVRSGAGVRLRLDSFVQRGKRITLRVTVPATEPIAIGRIQSVGVTPIIGREGSQTVNLPARTTVSGFIAEGEAVEDASSPVTAIHIASMHLSAKDGVDLPMDLSGVSPLSSSGTPRSKTFRSSARTADGRTFRLTSVVGWPDRLEIRMRVSGGRDRWFATDSYELVMQDARVSGNDLDEREALFRHVVFRVPPPWIRSAALRITVHETFIEGGWGWDFS